MEDKIEVCEGVLKKLKIGEGNKLIVVHQLIFFIDEEKQKKGNYEIYRNIYYSYFYIYN